MFSFLRACLVSVMLLLVVSPTLAADPLPAKPNIIIIFTDDQGYGDLGCYGSPNIKTPRIDAMAKEGVRFTDFYSLSPVCTPSRAALLTGSYPARLHMASGVLFPNATKGLNPSEITIAELLRDAGYRTACVGKWHLGDHPDFLPTKHGFDSYYGIPYSNDMRISRDGKSGPPLMRDEAIIEHPVDQTTITERLTEEGVKFIKAGKAAGKDQPFFLYLPHTMPHVPLFVSEKFKGKSERGLYGDVIETIDWGVGRILDTLKEEGLDDKTLVIFTSDNGPWLIKKDHGGSAGPLRQGKGTTWDGGMRVPFVARWPGVIPAGTTTSEVAAMFDLLPTICEAVGIAVPTDRVIDGKSILPLLRGEKAATSPHEAFFFYATSGRLEAVRAGQWKMHLSKGKSYVENDPPTEFPLLYDLSKDIGEKDNLAAANPQVVARLTKLIEDHQAALATTRRPVGTAKDVKEPSPGKNDK